ncbi:hypothetical protein KUCAC02_005830, partial [Chaenocephalus aceratus]
LIVTHGGQQHSFTDPKAALDYATRHFGAPEARPKATPDGLAVDIGWCTYPFPAIIEGRGIRGSRCLLMRNLTPPRLPPRFLLWCPVAPQGLQDTLMSSQRDTETRTMVILQQSLCIRVVCRRLLSLLSAVSVQFRCHGPLHTGCVFMLWPPPLGRLEREENGALKQR